MSKQPADLVVIPDPKPLPALRCRPIKIGFQYLFENDEFEIIAAEITLQGVRIYTGVKTELENIGFDTSSIKFDSQGAVLVSKDTDLVSEAEAEEALHHE